MCFSTREFTSKYGTNTRHLSMRISLVSALLTSTPFDPRYRKVLLYYYNGVQYKKIINDALHQPTLLISYIIIIIIVM